MKLPGFKARQALRKIKSKGIDNSQTLNMTAFYRAIVNTIIAKSRHWHKRSLAIDPGCADEANRESSTSMVLSKQATDFEEENCLCSQKIV